MTENTKNERQVILMGRDVGTIPCFRSTFLYSIGSGIGAAMVYFMFTSRIRMATHVGMGTFMSVTIGYWVYCRYHWSVTNFSMRQLQSVMKQEGVFGDVDVVPGTATSQSDTEDYNT